MPRRKTPTVRQDRRDPGRRHRRRLPRRFARDLQRAQGAGSGEEGSPVELIAEVQQHLGNDRVRAVAMDSTDGLARGVDVENTARRSPSRWERRRWAVFSTSSATRSTAATTLESGERWPIHRDAPNFEDLLPQIEIFETGIKVSTSSPRT